MIKFLLATTARFARLRCSLRLRRDVLQEKGDSIRAARGWSLLSWLGTLVGTISLLVNLGPCLEGPQALQATPLLTHLASPSYIKAKITRSRKRAKKSCIHFFHKTLLYGHRWIPLDPGNRNGTFWADPGPQGHWGPLHAEVTLSFLFPTPTIWVSMDSPGPQ